MHDAGKILTGLIIFLAILTFPIWYDAATGKASYVPEPKIVTEAKECVAPTDYMKAFHMDLLNQWRDRVVRTGERIYTSYDGKEYVMSLSNTCMDCHSNKEEFCDRCHEYSSVDPYCWNCHVEPEEARE
jgi:hypothetical protein